MYVKCIRVCKDVTLDAVQRPEKLIILFSVKVNAYCDSPRARDTEGHLPWLRHTTHGVTVTLRPEESL